MTRQPAAAHPPTGPALIIREARETDHAAIDSVVTAAFGGADEAYLVRALRDAGDVALEFVAEDEGQTAGHILLSRLANPPGCLALAPLAAAPDRQGKGIGSALNRAASDAAARAGWTAIFVLGDPQYYGRFGFDTGMAASFKTPYPIEYTSVLVIDAPVFRTLEKELVYPRAFSDDPGG